MHISATGYLEEGASCFTKAIADDEKMIEDSKEVETVSNLEKEKKKRVLHKEKRKAQALSLAAARLSAFVSAISVSGSALLSVSALLSRSNVFVPVPWLSASPSVSSVLGMSVAMPEFSAPLSVSGVLVSGSSALPSMFGVFVPIPRLLAPPSVSDMPIPGLFTPPSLSAMLVPALGLSLPPFSTWSFP